MTIIRADFGKNSDKGKKKEKPVPSYILHVSLAFSNPLIWRRLRVPGEMTLQQFHSILQLCMGWSGESNHQFYVGKQFYDMQPSSGGKGSFEGEYTLENLEEGMRWCFTYMYDAGDGWEHEIVLEEILEEEITERSPTILDGEWAAPPEKIGNVHSYEEYLYAYENPKEESSKKVLEFHGIEDFDPYHFDINSLNELLKESLS